MNFRYYCMILLITAYNHFTLLLRFCKFLYRGVSMNNLNFFNVSLPEDILKLSIYGDFEKENHLIDARLETEKNKLLRERLIYEKEKIKRLKLDYIYSFDDALAMAEKSIKDFTLQEFESLKDNGYADWRYINGKVMFQKNFLNNIKKTVKGISNRIISEDKSGSNAQKSLDDVVKQIIENGYADYFIHIKASVKLKDDSLKGKKVKVYLPIPAACEGIKNIKVINTTHTPKFISPENHKERTIYFEEYSKGSDEFSVEYSYENHVKYIKYDPEKVSSVQPDFYTDELCPHIVFTPYLKSLCSDIVGNETNPLLKARKIYDFVTTNIKYSFVRSYSTIPNLAEYAALNRKGDCGLLALLFITLCRIAKVPARWQSGLYTNPFSVGCHDWAQFYVAPYGWLYADNSFGGSAARNKNFRRWNFYFGNIDPFRMPANSDFQEDFTPDKKYFRSDPYDNQIGEIETEDANVYSGEFENKLELIEMHKM